MFAAQSTDGACLQLADGSSHGSFIVLGLIAGPMLLIDWNAYTQDLMFFRLDFES